MRSPMRAGVCQGTANRTNAQISAFPPLLRARSPGDARAHSGVGGHVGRAVTEEEAGAAAEPRRPVVRVVEGTAPQRGAAAADARGELVAQTDERVDLRVEPRPPGARDAVPVRLVRCA